MKGEQTTIEGDAMIYHFYVENVYERYSPWDVECKKFKNKQGTTVQKYDFSGHADYGFTQVIEEIEEGKEEKRCST